MSLKSSELGPNSVYHASALPEDRLTTELQRARRNSILDAAIDAARVGGYDLIHIRDVATRADVSLGTLYRYFPSKVHLLTRALERELMRLEDLVDDLAKIADPFVRLNLFITGMIDAMEQSGRVTDALAHAYVASNVAASVEADLIRTLTCRMLVDLMNDGRATDRDQQTADVITDVWTSEILALVQGRRSHRDVRVRLSTVVHLVARAPSNR